jgi:phosphoglycerol transferase
MIPSAKERATVIKSFNNNSIYFEQLEAETSSGAKILQYPYRGFPEVTGYAGAITIPYLHTKTLKFSGGAISGSPEDILYEKTADLPIPQLISELRIKDFAGILIDKLCFQEGEFSAIYTEFILITGDDVPFQNDRYCYFEIR